MGEPAIRCRGWTGGAALGAGAYVAGTVYSPFGEPLQLAMGNTVGKAIWQTFTYENGTRRLASAQLDRQVVPTADSKVSYTQDAAGNLTKVSDAPAAGAADTQCFSTDSLRRITAAWTPGSGDCAVAPSTAALGGPAPYWHSWSFDVTGNRLSETRHAAAGDSVDTYAYPGAGQDNPHGVTAVTTTGPGADSRVFGYDQAGNTTTRVNDGVPQTMSWDAEGHLAGVTDTQGTVAEYVYDANGNRLLAREQGSTTLYWGRHTEVTLTAASGTLSAARYYHFAGKTIAVRTGTSSSAVTTLIGDHHNTANYAVANTTGALSVRRTLPYGGPRGAAPASWPGNHGFLDKPVDTPTGLTHIGAREYDPGLGRFLSVDPIMDLGDPQQINGYSYANNNPLTYSDPTGLKFTQCDGPCSLGNAGQWAANGKSKVKETRINEKTWKRVANETRRRYRRPNATGNPFQGPTPFELLAFNPMRGGANNVNQSNYMANNLAQMYTSSCEMGESQVICYGHVLQFTSQPITIGDVLFYDGTKRDLQDRLDNEKSQRERLVRQL